jgi:hypothetical protein
MRRNWLTPLQNKPRPPPLDVALWVRAGVAELAYHLLDDATERIVKLGQENARLRAELARMTAIVEGGSTDVVPDAAMDLATICKGAPPRTEGTCGGAESGSGTSM